MRWANVFLGESLLRPKNRVVLVDRISIIDTIYSVLIF